MEYCFEKKININQPLATKKLTDAFLEIVVEKLKNFRHMVILCIGTDRSTGDSFGPLVGHYIQGFANEQIFVYGTIDKPIHAKNLEEKIKLIKRIHSDSLIVAIDACLGDIENIGTIIIKDGPLKPGTGVQKELPEVGDISITGIVNLGGFMEFMVLQNTRLSLVMKMADVTSYGIKATIRNISNKRDKSIYQMLT